MSNKHYPCDGEDAVCPFDAQVGYDCRNNCGMGVDEESEEEFEYEE